MSSESGDVLSLDKGVEEGSDFSSLSDSDTEPVVSTAPKRKILSAVKKAKENKAGKSKGKKHPPKRKLWQTKRILSLQVLLVSIQSGNKDFVFSSPQNLLSEDRYPLL